jgi:hypothetical protein
MLHSMPATIKSARLNALFCPDSPHARYPARGQAAVSESAKRPPTVVVSANGSNLCVAYSQQPSRTSLQLKAMLTPGEVAAMHQISLITLRFAAVSPWI